MTAALDTLPVTQLPPAGSYGPDGRQGVTALLFDPPALASLAARRGAGAALIATAREALGLDLIDAPRVSRAGGLSAIGTGPGRWLVLSETVEDLPARLAPLAAHAAITGQSDAYVGVALAGPHVHDLLAKGVALDLDPAAFPPGAAATTTLAHLNATFWRDPAEERFTFLVARSSHVAFVRFVVAAGAEFGLQLAHRG